ncbi:transketolase family protein [Alteribacillus bidgolensis]|uniref:Transketolase n=1 Tax=Alteribacillus bidgolensis TaxID=930129 RepID=A0A1G8I5C9_9BACI|nr:transketolase C-terminal domain-containing protein [Alteribacillus bidgolensis]SDI14034.1 transketolase [Alteribacillus bidgolensis]
MVYNPVHEKFDNSLEEGSWNISIANGEGSSAVSGKVLADIRNERDDIVVFTADVMYSNRLADFAKAHPESFINFGISEQHMVSAAAGIATTGKIPYIGTFASFLSLLSCEQIRTSVAYPNLPVRLIGHHSGMTMGFYGTSHHALEDLSILRSMAEMTIICPTDPAQVEAAIRSTVDHPGPIYFRMGRGRDKQVYENVSEAFELGKANELRDGKDVSVITNGLTLRSVVDAAAQLEEEGISVNVIDMHTIKPFDDEAVKQAVAKTGKIMTVEEHSVIGGIGSCAAEVIADNNLNCEFSRHGIYDEYVLIGPPAALYNHYDLDAEGVAKRIREFVIGSNKE